MIIKCISKDVEHYYVISCIDNIEDLKNNYKENKPLDAYLGVGTYMYRSNQLIKEQFTKCQLYLDNYLNYRDVSDIVDLKTLNEWNEFTHKHCRKCKNLKHGLCFGYYYKKENECDNYEISKFYKFIEYIKNIFNK